MVLFRLGGARGGRRHRIPLGDMEEGRERGSGKAPREPACGVYSRAADRPRGLVLAVGQLLEGSAPGMAPWSPGQLVRGPRRVPGLGHCGVGRHHLHLLHGVSRALICIL